MDDVGFEIPLERIEARPHPVPEELVLQAPERPQCLIASDLRVKPKVRLG